MEVRKARSWAIFCIAVWLAGIVAMAIVATENFYRIDPLIDAQRNQKFAADIEKLGRESVHDIMYYYSSELNRLYFQAWNLAQLPLGILTLWLIVKIPGAKRVKWEVVAMLAIVLFLTVLVTPFIVSVGRSLDFVPRFPPPGGLRTFGLLHATYTVLDGILLILGVLETADMALVTDAGTPTISDPGALVVQAAACRGAGIRSSKI